MMWREHGPLELYTELKTALTTAIAEARAKIDNAHLFEKVKVRSRKRCRLTVFMYSVPVCVGVLKPLVSHM